MSDVKSNRFPADESGMPEGISVAPDKMRITVGVSGSPASALALRWGAVQAERLHAALEVVLVLTIEQRAYYAPAISSDELDRSHQRAVARLAATVHTLAGYLPSDVVTMTVIQGRPERALVEQSAGADLLVLGSGAGLVGGRSFGPVVRACLSHAHCPVVVVGPDGPRGRARRYGADADRLDPATIHNQPDLLLVGPPPRAASGARRRS